MTLKNDAKFEEKLNLGFKNDIRNLVNFNVSGGQAKNLQFHVLLLSITYKVPAKNIYTQMLSLMIMKKDPKL